MVTTVIVLPLQGINLRLSVYNDTIPPLVIQLRQ